MKVLDLTGLTGLLAKLKASIFTDISNILDGLVEAISDLNDRVTELNTGLSMASNDLNRRLQAVEPMPSKVTAIEARLNSLETSRTNLNELLQGSILRFNINQWSSEWRGYDGIEEALDTLSCIEYLNDIWLPLWGFEIQFLVQDNANDSRFAWLVYRYVGELDRADAIMDVGNWRFVSRGDWFEFPNY